MKHNVLFLYFTVLSDKQIIAQSTMFLLAAYENTANTLAFLSYNLALHQDIQDKVYEEIQTVIGKVSDSIRAYADIHWIKTNMSVS